MALRSDLFVISVLTTVLCMVTAETGFLPENVTLPPEFKDKVNEKDIEKVQNKTKEYFKTKCEQNGGVDAFEKSQNAGADFTKCLQGLVDMSVLQAEVENAKPNGNVDEVFKKYCAKKQDFLGCAKQMLESSKLCFSQAERDNIKIVRNITEQLAEFICFKDGDRIALFIAEGGQECFEDKREEIQNCSKSIFGADINLGMQLDNVTTENMPQLTFDKKQCDQLSQLQLCVVDVLNTCTKPTSANIMESLFKFIRNGTPCKKYPDDGQETSSRKNVLAEQKNATGSASGLTITSAIFATALVSLFL